MPGVVMVSGGISGCGLTPLLGMLSIDSVVKMKKDKKYKEKYKQLKHQVQIMDPW
jgi:hypothetical protein